MDPSELRARFLAFCGPKRFRKFARSLYRESDEPAKFSRLRYWQETLWAEFSIAYPNAPSEVDTIGAILHWCDVHDAPLVHGPGHQPVDLRHSGLFDAARQTEFPHGFGWSADHCPACKEACIQWIELHPKECRVLQYLVHDAEWVAMHRNDCAFQETCRSDGLPWELIATGDEIWVIDTGRGPSHQAVVRNGFVVCRMD